MFVFGLIVGVLILGGGVLAGFRLGAKRWPWKGADEEIVYRRTGA